MFFKSSEECRQLVAVLGYGCIERFPFVFNKNASDSAIRVDFGSGSTSTSTYALANSVAGWIGSPSLSLLWITEFGIWPSSENLHLYYLVRRSYGDFRSLPDAPGHVFLKHEHEDLVTFIDLALQCGWGASIVGNGGSTLIAISHDSYLLVSNVNADDEKPIEESVRGMHLDYHRVAGVEER